MSGVQTKLPAGAHAAPGTRGISDAAITVSAREIITLTAEEIASLTAEVALEIAGSPISPDYSPIRRVTTTRHENPHLEHDPADLAKPRFYNRDRAYAPGLARFANAAVTESVKRSSAALKRGHPALKEGRTIFTSRVFDASERDRVLISGINNAKLGKKITKGDWAGSPFFHLSLEERKTCPRSCPVFDACYGNGMPAAVRFKYNANLMRKLDTELADLNQKHPNGFAVRLHVLGDFPDLSYVKAWIGFSNKYRALQIEGYTAHPRDSEIGQAIWKMNLNRPKRWVIRNSVPMDAPYEPLQVSTLWDGANTPPPGMDALVCPQELGKTRACSTCALCWSPAMKDKRVVFLGHGGRGNAPSAHRIK